jgi:hypothetical protein
MCSFEAAILAADLSIYSIEQSVTVFVLFFGFSDISISKLWENMHN